MLALSAADALLLMTSIAIEPLLRLAVHTVSSE
jgi:hypothetical protein